MDPEIKHTLARTRLSYALFWLSALVLVVAGEFGDAWVGWCAGNERLTYVAESVVILLTIVCVPLSLKAFAWALNRRAGQDDLATSLRRYTFWSVLRMVLLGLPLWSGLVFYYLILSHTCALCAAIALLASLFCVPGRGRLYRDLHIED